MKLLLFNNVRSNDENILSFGDFQLPGFEGLFLNMHIPYQKQRRPASHSVMKPARRYMAYVIEP
jgi:hypothetical protein